MYKTVSAFFESCGENVCSIPVLMQSVETFTNSIALIEDLDLEYTTVSKGATSHKKEMRSKLISETEKICGVLFIYGKKTDDTQIEEVVNVKTRALKKMPDSVLLLKTKKIGTLLDTTRAALPEYGISETRITTYGELVYGYEKSLMKAKSCKIKSIAARKSLSETFVQVDTLLRGDLDRLMKLIPDCFVKYQVARNLIHLEEKHNTIVEMHCRAPLHQPLAEEMVLEEISPAIYQTDLFSTISLS